MTLTWMTLNERITKMYRDGVSAAEIGKLVGLSRRAVSARLRRRGVLRTTPVFPTQKTDQNRMFVNGYGYGYGLLCHGCGKPGPRRRRGRPWMAQLDALRAAIDERGFVDFGGEMWCTGCRPRAVEILKEREVQARREALAFSEE